MTLAAFIMAVLRAVKPARDIFFKVSELYYTEMDAADANRTTANARKRDAYLAALMQPGLTDIQRDVIRRSLYDLHRN